MDKIRTKNWVHFKTLQLQKKRGKEISKAKCGKMLITDESRRWVLAFIILFLEFENLLKKQKSSFVLMATLFNHTVLMV